MEADSGRTCTAEPLHISNPAELWLQAKGANNIKALYKQSEVNDNDLQQWFAHDSPGDTPIPTSSWHQQGPRNTLGGGASCWLFWNRLCHGQITSVVSCCTLTLVGS